MPQPHDWTPHEDSLIRQFPSRTWTSIAAEIGVARWTVVDRAKKIGVWVPESVAVQVETRDPEPLPAGHPTSWDAITRGTVLEGSAFG